ncbi:MAG: protein phosphatase 2C domain-containing protein, partial [Acidithiobacillus sp.]|nr:protein phosphatase 2C domain-containing protein [Acidithiobacillus sp.]
PKEGAAARPTGSESPAQTRPEPSPAKDRQTDTVATSAPAAVPEPSPTPSDASVNPVTTPVPMPPAPPPLLAVPLAVWRCTGEAVVGLAHRRKGIPCQDAVYYQKDPRLVLVLSDGAGSATVSDLGAAAMTRGVARLLTTFDDLVSAWLDEPLPDLEAERLSRSWQERILRHAQGILDDLAAKERRPVRDLRGTLLLCVVGLYRLFWWKVGDGAIVIRSPAGLRALGNPAQAKGEFANQTVFVDQAIPQDVQAGLVPTCEALGIALMSDGGAEKLVTHDGSRVAGRLGQWFDETLAERFTPDRIALAYHDPSMYERTNLDDCSVALAAR